MAPPSVSNTSLSTSVCTSMRSRGNAAAAGAPEGGAEVLVAAGTAVALAAGGVAEAAAEAGALARAATLEALGKKVALWPL